MGINFYDNNQLGLFGLMSGSLVRVNSVAEMVEYVLKQNEGAEIFLYGDGKENYQSVGAGANFDLTGDRSLQLGEDGKLLGSAAIWLPKIAKYVQKIHLMGLDTENFRSLNLMIQVGKAMGIGTWIYGRHSMLIYKGDGTEPIRRTTESATMDREAVRKRLAQYTNV